MIELFGTELAVSLLAIICAAYIVGIVYTIWTCTVSEEELLRRMDDIFSEHPECNDRNKSASEEQESGSTNRRR